MTGLDKILNKINGDSAARVEAITENAEKQCAQIMAQAEEDGKKIASKIEADARKESENIISMARSGAEQTEKRAVLAAKVEAVNSVLKELLTSLLALPESEYFSAVLKLARDNAMSGECVAMLSSRDLARLPSDFDKKLAAELAEKKAACVLSKEPADIESGIILIYGDIEINCSFEAIIEANADIYKAKISEIIF